MNSERLPCIIVIMDILVLAVFAKEIPKDPCKCGISNGDPSLTVNDEYMILNGATVKPSYRFPWMVKIMKNEIPACWGSLISKDYVITAGQCVKRFVEAVRVNKTHCYERKNKVSKCNYEPKNLQVSFVTKTYQMSRNQKVKKVIVHPKYTGKGHDYDMALIQLEESLKCKTFRRPICLPENSNLEQKPGTKAIAAGWGSHNKTRKGVSPKLLATMLLFITKEKCEKETNIKPGAAICAFGIGNQGTCFGDSGSPVFRKKKGRYYFSAIASAVATIACKTNLPSFFTPILPNMKWISQYVKKEE